MLTNVLRALVNNPLFEGFFRVPSHVLSVGGMTLLGLGSFRELRPELNIGPRGPTATGVSF